MAQSFQKQKSKVRRDVNSTQTTQLSPTHRRALCMLTNACMLGGIGVYIGKARRDGTISVKFYTPDGAVEDFLCTDDEPITWAAAVAADVLPTPEQGPLADELASLRPQNGSGAPKPQTLVRRAVADPDRG